MNPTGWTQAELRATAMELKTRYPEMLGVGFYGRPPGKATEGGKTHFVADLNDTATLELITFASKLSKELFPDHNLSSWNLSTAVATKMDDEAASCVGYVVSGAGAAEVNGCYVSNTDVSPQIEVGGTNSRASECLSRMLPWALLGAQNPPEELRARLRQTQLDFEMRKLKESKYSITPVKYHGNTGGPTAAIVDSVRPETNYFSLPRYFGASSQSKRIGLRLRCLPVLQPPGTSATVLLDGTAADKRQMTVSSSSGLLMTAAWAPGPPRTGVSEETLALTAHVNATEAYVPTSEWARATFEYTTEVDLSTPSAAEHAERAIAAWVWSDGCGGVLNVQLGAGAGYGLTQREYYTHLTWTGWKLLLLEQQETALTLFDFEWPYNQESSQ